MSQFTLQVVEAAQVASPRDWGSIAAWASAVVALVAFIVTLFSLRNSRAQHRTSKDQLAQARSSLEDRRLDERVKAILGENVLLINGLMEKAKSTLQEAENTAETVREIRNEVDRIRTTLKEHAGQSDDSRKKLEQALNRADEVLRDMNMAAKQASEDSKIISGAREAVTAHAMILERTEEVLRKLGYTVLPNSKLDHRFPYDLKCSFGQLDVYVEVKILATGRVLTPTFILEDLNHSSVLFRIDQADVTGNAPTNARTARCVIVVDHLTQASRELAVDWGIEVIEADNAYAFFRELAVEVETMT